TAWATARTAAMAFAAPDPSIPRFLRADQRATLGMVFRWPAGIVASLQTNGRWTMWAAGQTAHFRFAPRWSAAINQTLGRAYGDKLHRIHSSLEAVWMPTIFGRVPPALTTTDELDLLMASAQVRGRLASDLRFSWGRIFVEAAAGYGRSPATSAPARWGPLILRGGVQGAIHDLRLSAEVHSYWATTEDDAPAGLAHAYIEGARFRSRIMGAVWGRVPPLAWFIAPEEIVPSSTLQSQRDGIDRWRPLQAVEWTFEYDWPWFSAGLQLGFSSGVDAALLQAAYPDGSNRSLLQTVGLNARYRSVCRCWSAGLAARYDRDLRVPSVSFDFALGL
ncbi:MAG: hypothetical protein AAFV29_04935, partial [Myxococcota bacterium]